MGFITAVVVYVMGILTGIALTLRVQEKKKRKAKQKAKPVNIYNIPRY